MNAARVGPASCNSFTKSPRLLSSNALSPACFRRGGSERSASTLNDPEAEGGSDRLGARMDIKLLENRGDVMVDCLCRQVQLVGKLRVRIARDYSLST